MSKLLKIRIGNDFTFLLEVKRDGVPEDLTHAYEREVTLRVGNSKIKVPTDNVSYVNNYIVRVELTPDLIKTIGVYWLEFKYVLPYNGNVDDDLKCAVDADICEIVPRTAQADDINEIVGVGDVLIGLKGDRGYSAYEIAVQNGFQGTEEEWLDSLKADSIADSGDMKTSVYDPKDIKGDAFDYTNMHGVPTKLSEFDNDVNYSVIHIVEELPEHGNPGEFYATIEDVREE